MLLLLQVRLEKAKDATQVPLEIAFDNMRCRDRRYNADLVRDAVEIELLKVTYGSKNTKNFKIVLIIEIHKYSFF